MKSKPKYLESPHSTSSYDTSNSTLNHRGMGDDQEKNSVEALKKLIGSQETLVDNFPNSSDACTETSGDLLAEFSNI